MSGSKRSVSGSDYEQALMQEGLSADEARAWRFLTQVTSPTTQPLLETPLLATPLRYRDAGLTATDAVEWFFIGIGAENASQYTQRGWTPDDIVRLRGAIYDTKGQPGPPGDSPLERQPGEIRWIKTTITPHLVHLYVLAGQQPAMAQALDRKRLLGDTTIEITMATMAALRRPLRVTQDAQQPD
jgi:hypothetical protein